ncbi:MAG: adenosylcobinamide-GDP ribazoletransferase [Gammaproteobacteria bacterium]|nr:adenosylcobinamide-GDP ribazoletransferase [Gammaproteobacteria bacterium]MYD75716.1 adenosylcobinamide-GDP ribazoletransferase [Gammaproteobacteria bacterium]MYJ52129.1 adenosylcobinamide-GDP ribazoletransferase [Gammaproteobacteria bacterium]
MIEEFRQAIGFLTRFPVGSGFRHEPELSGPAVSWYGVAGLIIGLTVSCVGGIMMIWPGVPAAVGASLALAAWVAVTGALHLDGLADCGDSVMGGFDRQRMLDIMKDSRVGTGAVVTVVTVLLIKWACLTWLFSHSGLLAPLFAAALARLSLSLTIMQMPYVRHEGLGTDLQGNIRHRDLLLYGGATLLILLVASPSSLIVAMLGAVVGCALVWLFVARKIGGYTGDVYGAQVEVAEATALVALTVLA